MDKLKFNNYSMTWLNGGMTQLDGGAMFGVVPKPLWSKKYPHNEKNQIPLATDPILIQAGERNILLESGIGSGKLTDKQKRNFGVSEESDIVNSLARLGLTPLDIDMVLMTHLHFDHACGLTHKVDGVMTSLFKNAEIITTEKEWAEMRNPNIRSKNTYWKENWEPIESQVRTFSEEYQVSDGITMYHTGGHSDGHAILVLEHDGGKVIHMGDIMPTHAHANPLWVLAYDDYPMDSVFAKEKWMKYGLSEKAIFTFYHDAIYRAVTFSEDGKEIDWSLKRNG